MDGDCFFRRRACTVRCRKGEGIGTDGTIILVGKRTIGVHDDSTVGWITGLRKSYSFVLPVIRNQLALVTGTRENSGSNANFLVLGNWWQVVCADRYRCCCGCGDKSSSRIIGNCEGECMGCLRRGSSKRRGVEAYQTTGTHRKSNSFSFDGLVKSCEVRLVGKDIPMIWVKGWQLESVGLIYKVGEGQRDRQSLWCPITLRSPIYARQYLDIIHRALQCRERVIVKGIQNRRMTQHIILDFLPDLILKTCITTTKDILLSHRIQQPIREPRQQGLKIPGGVLSYVGFNNIHGSIDGLSRSRLKLHGLIESSRLGNGTELICSSNHNSLTLSSNSLSIRRDRGFYDTDNGRTINGTIRVI